LGELNGRFVALMERLLWLYALPYDPDYPVVCFDERPCFLIGQTLSPLNLHPGQVAREHYAYTKQGSCALLAAIEPKTGQRLAKLFAQRTKREYALFLQALAERYPAAKKIRLVQDNLNTHDVSALYESFPAEEAFALAQRFEFFFTPKSASWLNMIEIEFSALARECLHRRLPTFEVMEREVLALVEERAAKALKIDWQFSISAARDKFVHHYQRLREEQPLCYDI
jgi:hypothetical protein